MNNSYKTKILICGILPPPSFGHSVMYKTLMDSAFVNHFDITFLDMKFWSYGKHKKVTLNKLLKMIKYLFQYIYLLIVKRPKYVLYNMSFYKMPFLKDFLFCFVGKLFGAKIVIHDFGQYIKELHDTSNGFFRWILRCYMNITTASIIMGEQTKVVYKGFLSEDKLYVVPGCAEDTWELNGGKREKSQKYGYINVLYFSFISELKGAYVAMKALGRILQIRNDIGFTFAGPFESKKVEDALNQLITQYPERVRYSGHIDDATKRTEIFRKSDIFMFPTLRDVFGLVLLHALAENIPVIASKEGNIPSIITDNENGLLFEKGSDQQLARAITQLADNDNLRKKLGKDNRKKYLKEYSLDMFGQKMIDVFRFIEDKV